MALAWAQINDHRPFLPPQTAMASRVPFSAALHTVSPDYRWAECTRAAHAALAAASGIDVRERLREVCRTIRTQRGTRAAMPDTHRRARRGNAGPIAARC